MRTVAAVLIALALPWICRAGFCNSDPVPGDTRHAFEFFVGYSPASATLIGTTTDRRFVAAGFEYRYRCWAWENWSISYSPALLPAAILLQPAQYSYSRVGVAETPAHAVYGFGMLPVVFTADLVQRHAVHPFIEAGVGVIASTEPIPIDAPDATGLNFLVDVGGGLEWRAGARHAIDFGYKFLHISNAYTSSFNPGVDNNVFYLGFSLLR